MEIKSDWQPSEINELPEPLRRYIHDLEALCDPAGLVRENWMLREELRILKSGIFKIGKGKIEISTPGHSVPPQPLKINPTQIVPHHYDPYRLESNDEVPNQG